MAFVVLLAVAVLWIATDFAYSRIVFWQLERYEKSLSWDEQGVRRGEDAFREGEGDTAILFVHGINFSPIAFRHWGPELARRGFAVRAMRLPGFAMPVRKYAEFKYPQWVTAVDREVNALAAVHHRVVIAAHSLGAAVVIRYLLESPVRVAGVVLVAPAVEVSNARSPFLPTRFWHEFAKRATYFSRVVLSPFEYDVRDRDVIGTIPAKQFTPRAIVDETFTLIDQNRGQARNIHVPLLMIVSSEDQVISTPAAVAYFHDWGSDQKTLQIQEQSGHMIPLDFGWQKGASAIETFAHQLEGGKSGR